MKLFEIAQNYKNLTDLMDNEDVPAEMITAALDQVGGDLNEKLENIVKFIRNIEAEAVALRTEEIRMSNLRHARENRVDSLKRYAEDALNTAGLPKVKAGLFTLAIQANPQSVDVINAGEIPMAYYIAQEPKLDKKSLLDALKQGESVPGAALKQTRGLRIK